MTFRMPFAGQHPTEARVTMKSSPSPSFSRITNTLDYLTRLRFSAVDTLWMSASMTLLLQGQLAIMVAVVLLGTFISVMAEKIHRNRVRDEMLRKVEEFDCKWKKLADERQVSAAVAEYRRCYGSTLYEAKSKVFTYLDRVS